MLNLFQHLLSLLKLRFRNKFGMTKQFLEVPILKKGCPFGAAFFYKNIFQPSVHLIVIYLIFVVHFLKSMGVMNIKRNLKCSLIFMTNLFITNQIIEIFIA